LGIDRQFLWGSGVAITPVLEAGATDVRGYFPDARWFDFYDGAELAVHGEYVTLPAPFDFIPVHIRGGVIIPTQDPAINTEASRQNPFGLIVPLDENQSANGVLYYDDGDSVDPQVTMQYFAASYSYANGVLTSAVVNDGYEGISSKILGSLRLLGAGTITSVTVNGQPHSNFTTLPSGEVKVSGLTVALASAFTISFN